MLLNPPLRVWGIFAASLGARLAVAQPYTLVPAQLPYCVSELASACERVKFGNCSCSFQPLNSNVASCSPRHEHGELDAPSSNNSIFEELRHTLDSGDRLSPAGREVPICRRPDGCNGLHWTPLDDNFGRTMRDRAAHVLCQRPHRISV